MLGFYHRAAGDRRAAREQRTQCFQGFTVDARNRIEREPKARRAVEHPRRDLEQTPPRLRAQTTSKTPMASPDDDLMYVDLAPRPGMPGIVELTNFRPVGAALPRCSTPSDRTRRSARPNPRPITSPMRAPASAACSRLSVRRQMTSAPSLTRASCAGAPRASSSPKRSPASPAPHQVAQLDRGHAADRSSRHDEFATRRRRRCGLDGSRLPLPARARFR